MPDNFTEVRLAGSGRTAFRWNGQVIAWLEAFGTSPQDPVGQGNAGPGMEIIHPLGKKYPAEVVTSRAFQHGQLTITIREIWNTKWWHQFPGLDGTHDLIDIWKAIARRTHPVTCAVIIRKPNGRKRGEVFHNVWPLTVHNDETIQLGSLSVPRTMTCVFLKRTNLAGTRYSPNKQTAGSKQVSSRGLPDADDDFARPEAVDQVE